MVREKSQEVFLVKKRYVWLFALFIGSLVLGYGVFVRPSLSEFADVTGKDLRRIGENPDELWFTLRFDNNTRWPHALPEGFEPDLFLDMGTDPGLGIRSLHEEGITGEGVAVAVIDGPMLVNHQEYADRIVSYHQRLRPSVNRYHGTMATSVLAGETTGVAPEATIHYFEADLGKRETIEDVIKQIIEFNNDLPQTERIRVISISLGPSERYQETWDLLAEESGIVIVHCDWDIGSIGCPIGRDRNDPTQYELGNFFAHLDSYDQNTLLVPTDYRSVANDKDQTGYIFVSRGGISLGAPYLAGLITLAFQVNPDLSPQRIVQLLQQSGDSFKHGGRVVNPWQFITMVRAEQ